jgi:hypothetical protein
MIGKYLILEKLDGAFRQDMLVGDKSIRGYVLEEPKVGYQFYLYNSPVDVKIGDAIIPKEDLPVAWTSVVREIDLENNIIKQRAKVEIYSNHYLVTDSFSGVCLVQHFPQKRKNKDGFETDYTAEEKFYFPSVAMALEQYVKLKQIILPEVSEMLEIQKQVLGVLEDFRINFKNW